MLPLFAYQPEGLIATAICVIVSTVAFGALIRTEIGVWWSLLLAAVIGVAVVALMAACGYGVDLIERFRQKKPARPEKHNPPDGPQQDENATP